MMSTYLFVTKYLNNKSLMTMLQVDGETDFELCLICLVQPHGKPNEGFLFI
jgi:hypothetical protein